MYNYRSHTEIECDIQRFIEMYLYLTMSEGTHVEPVVLYKPQSLAFKIILKCERNGVKVCSVYECLDESADAKEISRVVEMLIDLLKEEYGKEVSKKLLRRRD